MNNLLKLYQLDPLNGLDWYYNTNAQARKIARNSGLSLVRTSGIISALSCNTGWGRNLKCAREYCLTGNTGHLPMALDKAQRVKEAQNEAEILTILNSPKLQNFFLNIAKPELSGPVTIDRHAWGAWVYGPVRVAHKVRITPKRYRMASEAYRELADKLNLLPHELQAVVWSNYRML